MPRYISRAGFLTGAAVTVLGVTLLILGLKVTRESPRHPSGRFARVVESGVSRPLGSCSYATDGLGRRETALRPQGRRAFGPGRSVGVCHDIGE